MQSVGLSVCLLSGSESSNTPAPLQGIDGAPACAPAAGLGAAPLLLQGHWPYPAGLQCVSVCCSPACLSHTVQWHATFNACQDDGWQVERTANRICGLLYEDDETLAGGSQHSGPQLLCMVQWQASAFACSCWPPVLVDATTSSDNSKTFFTLVACLLGPCARLFGRNSC